MADKIVPRDGKRFYGPDSEEVAMPGQPKADEPKPLTDEELADIATKAGRFADAHEPALLLFARTCIDLVAEVRRLRGQPALKGDSPTDEELDRILQSADQVEAERAENDGMPFESYGPPSEHLDWWVPLEPDTARRLVATIRELRGRVYQLAWDGKQVDQRREHYEKLLSEGDWIDLAADEIAGDPSCCDISSSDAGRIADVIRGHLDAARKRER